MEYQWLVADGLSAATALREAAASSPLAPRPPNIVPVLLALYRSVGRELVGAHRQRDVTDRQSRRSPTRARTGRRPRWRGASAGDSSRGRAIGTRTLQRAVDRGLGGLEDGGDLGDAPVEDVVKDQRGALARRQHQVREP